jgi:hypothetical protein
LWSGGFGVEIVEEPEVSMIYIAEDEQAQRVREAQANEFGTRHRSIFRYCSAHEDSLGFIVSQDGLIRAIRRIGERVIMWENVKVFLSTEGGEHEEGTCPHCRVEVEGGCEAPTAPEAATG